MEWYEKYKDATQKAVVFQALTACSARDCKHCLYQGKGIKCMSRLMLDAAEVLCGSG